MPLESFVRARVRIAFILLSLAFAAPAALAQTPTVWTLPGGATSSDPAIAKLVQVTPYSTSSAVAAQLAQRPAGARGLLMTGFTDDLTTRDKLQRPGLGAVPYVKSPWIDTGTAVVHARADSWMAKLLAKGATVDFVVVQSSASLQSSAFSPYGATGWKSISQDVRFPVLNQILGASYLPTDMASATQVRARWNDYFTAKVDTALSISVGAAVTRYYPNAKVVSSGRYVLGTAGAMTPARAGAVFGTHDQPQFYGQSAISQPLLALAAIASDARAVRAASGHASVPSVASPSWPGQSGGQSAFAGTPYWDELIYHLALNGAPFTLMDKGTISTADRTAIDRVHAAIRARAPSAAFTPHTVVANYDANTFVVSAGQVGQMIHERISVAPDAGPVLVTYNDATSVILTPEAGAAGVWAQHPSSQEIAFIQLTSQATGSSGYSVLYDVGPTAEYVPPIAGASQYLILYQNSADPSAWFTGIVDPALVVAEVANMISQSGEPEWGVLDFEVPFDDILTAGPSHPQYAASIQSLVDTIRAVKTAYPNVKWTYYGFPRISYHPIGKDWGQVALVDRPQLYHDYVAPYAPLMEEMDWFMPCMYDTYERAMGAPDSYSLPFVAETEFRKCSVEAIRYYFEHDGREVPPVIPAVSPWFMSEVQAHMFYVIPADEFYEEQVQPTVVAGASGLAVWCSMKSFLHLSTMTGPVSGDYSIYIQPYLRTAFAHDYLGGVDPATVDWGSAETHAALLNGLNQNLNSTLLTVWQAQSLMGP